MDREALRYNVNATVQEFKEGDHEVDREGIFQAQPTENITLVKTISGNYCEGTDS